MYSSPYTGDEDIHATKTRASSSWTSGRADDRRIPRPIGGRRVDDRVLPRRTLEVRAENRRAPRPGPDEGPRGAQVGAAAIEVRPDALPPLEAVLYGRGAARPRRHLPAQAHFCEDLARGNPHAPGGERDAEGGPLPPRSGVPRGALGNGRPRIGGPLPERRRRPGTRHEGERREGVHHAVFPHSQGERRGAL